MPPPIPPAPERSRVLRWVFFIVAGSCLLPIILVVGRHLLFSAKIKTKLSQIRAAKEPVTTEELDSYYKKLPLDTNGAKFYLDAAASVRKTDSYHFLENTDELPKGTNALPEELRQSMEKAVANGKSALETLRKAAAFGACRYPIDYTGGWFASLAHLRDLRVCGHLEQCNGILKEQSGDIDGSIKSAELICQYAQSLDKEPDLISVLIQQALNLRAYDLSLWILNHRTLSSGQLATLQTIFSHREPTDWIDRAFIGDRCCVLTSFNYPAARFADTITDSQSQPSDVLAIQFVRLMGQMKKDELVYLDRMNKIREIARLPFPEGPDRIEQLLTEIKIEASSKMLFATGSILPALVKSIGRDAQHVARIHLIETALAIEQYRIAHQTLPKSLNDLKPSDSEILLDPFDGDQLGCNLTEHGYTLYSVGPDQEDDGGEKSVPLYSKDYSKDQTPLGDLTLSILH